MERELEERVLSYMREKHMIEEKQAILAGVSGGADSVCLLLLLCSLKSRLDLRLFVVHVEHGVLWEADMLLVLQAQRVLDSEKQYAIIANPR